MIQALVLRRFNATRDGIARVVEAARLVELPALPLHGYVLTFEDGTGEAGVAAMRIRAWPAPRPPGIYPAAVEIRTGAESGDRLAGALEAGWQEIGA